MLTVTICVVPRYSAPKTVPRSARGVVEADMLGPHAEGQLAVAAVLVQLRHGDLGAVDADLAGPLCRPERKWRKFIGGEPMKSATNIDAGRS